MLINGVWAEVEVSGEHLRLFSEHNAQGVQSSVYNVKTRTWIAPSESVDDIEQGKDRAESYAKAYLEVGRPSPSQVSPKKEQSRFPRRSKYFGLNQRGLLFGCLRRAHCQRLEKML